jgi:lipopolysaccharide export system protein LptC
MIGRWIPVALLLAFAIGTVWLLHKINVNERTEDSGSAHTPDYFVEDFLMTTMDDGGSPKRRVHAEFMAHFPDTDTKELEKPHLIMFHPTRPPWHVRSSRASISADDNEIALLGEVYIWRENAEHLTEFEIETQDLTVFADAQYGETDKPVIIRTPQSESRGIGMQAFLEEDRIILQSQVRTRYEKHAY